MRSLRKPLAAAALIVALVLPATPAAAHTGHHTGFSRHYVSLYVYEQGYAIQTFNPWNPFCWGAATWIKTVDSRTGQRTRSDFKRCW